jgi:hypothetical protein
MTVYFLHASNIVWVICFGLRDVLLLRILAISAILVSLPYYLFPPKLSGPSWVPIFWQSVFMLINIGWVITIILERRPPRMSPEERKLYEFTFRESCTPRELLLLLNVAEWQTAEQNETLLSAGELAERLIVITQGKVAVRQGKKELARLRDGDIVGDISFLTSEPSITDVLVLEPTQYVSWNRTALEEIYKQRIELKSAIQGIIGHNLVHRLNSPVSRVPELSLHG